MPDVLQGLQDKHPEAADIAEESLLHGPIDYTPPNVYDLIDEESIYNSASKTKGSAGPSGMDAELYKRILCSKNFKPDRGQNSYRRVSRVHKKSAKEIVPPILT